MRQTRQTRETRETRETYSWVENIEHGTLNAFKVFAKNVDLERRDAYIG
jgi:hypothetical protein